MDLWERVVSEERSKLVAYCARFTDDSDAAEDLTQQTLLEAWRCETELRDPQARQGWLFGIARNVCLHWLRSRGRERRRRAGQLGPRVSPAGHEPAEAFDLEAELERDELARLLDRAMALLPPETRDALVWKYVEESPQAAIAARLGLTEGAVEARLHRGRLALRKALTTDLADEAAAHGLVSAEDAGWQATRIWCPSCGQRRLLGRFTEERELRLDCVGCLAPGATGRVIVVNSRGIELLCGVGSPELFRGIRGFKPALNRVIARTHEFYGRGLSGRTMPCHRCGSDVRLRPHPWAGPTLRYSVRPSCRNCGETAGIGAVVWRALERPEGRAFWREHERIRMLPDRDVEAAGGPAIVCALESVATNGRLEVVFTRDTLEVVAVRRS